MSAAEITGIVLGAIGAAAVIAPVLRFISRRLTMLLDSARNEWRRLPRWYAHCEEREFVAMLVNNPREATPVFSESLLDSEKIVHWRTQIGFGHAFVLYAIWKYRGFWAALGWHVAQGSDDLTWAVAPPLVFLSVSGSTSQRVSHWTGSELIDATTAYVDKLIEESGVADYTPPRRFRVVRWLRNSLLNPKAWRREKQTSES